MHKAKEYRKLRPNEKLLNDAIIALEQNLCTPQEVNFVESKRNWFKRKHHRKNFNKQETILLKSIGARA